MGRRSEWRIYRVAVDDGWLREEKKPQRKQLQQASSHPFSACQIAYPLDRHALVGMLSCYWRRRGIGCAALRESLH